MSLVGSLHCALEFHFLFATDEFYARFLTIVLQYYFDDADVTGVERKRSNQ